MFARIKKSGRYQYLQIVENNKIGGKDSQRCNRCARPLPASVKSRRSYRQRKSRR
jgi:hypothetical protein